jgi:hypothetical protein
MSTTLFTDAGKWLDSTIDGVTATVSGWFESKPAAPQALAIPPEMMAMMAGMMAAAIAQAQAEAKSDEPKS